LRSISYGGSIVPVVAAVVIFLTIVVPAALADEIARAGALDFCVALAPMGSTGAIEGTLRIASIATGGQQREKHQKKAGCEAHEVLTLKT